MATIEQLEKRIKELEEDFAESAIFMASVDGDITYANPAAYSMFGYDELQQDLLGVNFKALCPAETLEFFQ